MKTTVTRHMFVETFNHVCANQFCRAGLLALFDYLERLEQECGTEYELDPVAICCDYTEYATAVEAAVAYGFECRDEDDDIDAEAREREYLKFLTDKTTVLEFDGGVIVQNF